MTRITEPTEAVELLRSADVETVLHMRDSAPLLEGSVLTLSGRRHLDRRRIEARLMARDALRHYEDAVLVPAIGARLAERTARRRDDGLVDDDLLVLVRRVLVQLTARMIGLDGTDDASELERLYDCAERFGEAASVEWSLGDHTEIVRRGLAASDEFVDRWFATSLARRRAIVDRHRAASPSNGSLPASDLPVDLLTMLLVHASELDDDLIRREAIFFLLASSSTTTHAAPHVVMEILDWLDAHPDDRPLLEDVDFAKCAVNEGLRLHPPVPALLKRTLTDVTLSTGRVVPAGEFLAVDLDAVNRSPDVVGPDPERFDPRRPYARSAHPYALSFGDGPHMCLGRPLATSTTRTGPDDGTVGTLVRLVVELGAAGIALDPAAGLPQPRTDTSVDRFATFPVVFTRL